MSQNQKMAESGLHFLVNLKWMDVEIAYICVCITAGQNNPKKKEAAFR